MKVCIVRHGSAEMGADADASRQLTEKGSTQAQGAGRWLASMLNDGKIESDVTLYSSPYIRARQTAEAISAATGIAVSSLAEQVDGDIVPAGNIDDIVDFLSTQEGDIILVSHLPLVGRLAAKLVDGEVYDQPWSPAECWLLEGDPAASGCMTVTAVWYPALEE